MPNYTKIYWLQTISPLHVGSGRGTGFVDMPIIREKATEWPYVPGSSVKGVLRDYFEQKKDPKTINTVFGPQKSDDSSNAGSLVMTDAHIICLPVRSLYGTFAYVTSPLVLARLARDLKAAGCDSLPELPHLPERGDGKDPENALVTPDSVIAMNEKVFLEDLDLSAKEAGAKEWAGALSKLVFRDEAAWEEIFKSRFAIISDDTFKFLANAATEVTPHITIDDKRKTVAGQALWYEESLPAETILAGIAWCDRVFGNNGLTREQILRDFCTAPLNLQIGGRATVGKGLVRCSFSGVS